MAGMGTQKQGTARAHINIRTNEPLSITPGDRGIVTGLSWAGNEWAPMVLCMITATEAAWPDGVAAIDKKLREALLPRKS